MAGGENQSGGFLPLRMKYRAKRSIVRIGCGWLLLKVRVLLSCHRDMCHIQGCLYEYLNFDYNEENDELNLTTRE